KGRRSTVMSDRNDYKQGQISAVPKREPSSVPSPRNCKNPCPYGRGREFCFPCYAQLMKKKG
uniref:hypothetical protein n=1 Tax=Acetatifactor sp. TaxID=1872090 RepID=UPI00405735AE